MANINSNSNSDPMVDGDLTTSGTSDPDTVNSNGWVTVDLGQTYFVKVVTVVNVPDQGSTDGKWCTQEVESETFEHIQPPLANGLSPFRIVRPG